MVHRVQSFPEVIVTAGSDGTDMAMVEGSDDPDTFTGRLHTTFLEDTAQAVYSVAVKSFDEVEATGGAGDLADLRGTVGSETYTGTPTLGTFEGTVAGVAYVNKASMFPEIVVAGRGNSDDDTGVVYGLPGKDIFQGTWAYGRLAKQSATAGPDYLHRVYRFETLDVYPTMDGVPATQADAARFFDGPNDDEFNGTPTESQMLYRRADGTDRFDQRVHDFPRVQASAGAGFDVANLTGNSGDVYNPVDRKLTGDDYEIQLLTDFDDINVSIPPGLLGWAGPARGMNSTSADDDRDRDAAVDLLMTTGDL
jgi:hypothetical protein